MKTFGKVTMVTESSQVRSISYSGLINVLFVEFKNGTVYKYINVPESEFVRFKHAPSPGSFLATNIKGQYQYEKTEMFVNDEGFLCLED